MARLIFFALTFLVAQCIAGTVELWFNVTWVMANPDGMFERKVIGINNTWPLPVINVDKGDNLIVHTTNGLGDKDTSIHWHGMYQNGTSEMDGASMVSQCPIPPGSSFTYNFTINQNGTYWYHCHVDFCYPDGYRQALIVHDKDAYFADEVEEEFVVTLSDWYHDLVEDIPFLTLYNPTGAEPIPDSFLFNDTMNSSLPVKPNKTYLIRLINISAFTGQYFYIEDHTFRIVEIDGVYVDAAEADVIYLSVAQRYAILVTTKDTTDKNFGIVTIADQVLFDGLPPELKLNYTNWLEYNSSAPHEQAQVTLDVVDGFPAFDDFTLVPHDRQPLLGEPSKRIELTVIMEELANGLPYALLNNITFTPPKVPVIYTALTAGDLATNSIVYGEYTNPFVLEHNEVVEVVLNNNDGGTHPFHLHGHNFQLLSRTPSYGDDFYSYGDLPEPVPFDPSNHTAFPEFPARRDTFVLPPQGSFVIRFVADNPGVWLFHCHIDWHLSQGLASVFIEAPTQLQQRTTIPADHLATCAAANVPSKGNAAANAEDFLDLSGQNRQSGVIPYGGFTAKGIVAMTFSIISALLGIVALTIYGLSDMKYAVPADGRAVTRIDAAGAKTTKSSDDDEDILGGREAVTVPEKMR